MTIHRAKGLEFPVVVRRRPRPRSPAAGARPLLVGDDGTAGLRARAARRRRHDPDRRLGAPRRRADAAADAEEERRLFYVAMTRARELLILSGGTDTTKWPAPRNGGPPIDWIVRALVDDPRATFALAAGMTS